MLYIHESIKTWQTQIIKKLGDSGCYKIKLETQSTNNSGYDKGQAWTTQNMKHHLQITPGTIKDKYVQRYIQQHLHN